MDSELAFAPATELRRMIAGGEVSSVELTELFYRRIEALNPQLNAYLVLCPDQALAAARAADDGHAAGRRPGAAAWHPRVHQGFGADEGRRDDDGFRPVSRPDAGYGFNRGGTRARRRGGHLGQDQYAGVRAVRHH